MVTANIIINQTGKPGGLPGESRDDLSLGATVTLSNEENSGVIAWNWRLLAIPPGSTAGLTNPTAATCTFTPDVEGSYLIQLLLNGRIRATAIAAVKTSYLGLRIPAVGETVELGGWEKTFQIITGQLEIGIQDGGGGSNLVVEIVEEGSNPFVVDLTVVDSGKTYTAESNTIEISFILPPAAAGLHFQFIEKSTYQTMKIYARTGDTIRQGKTLSNTTPPSIMAVDSGDGEADGIVKGMTINMFAINDTEWIVTTWWGIWELTGGE